MKTIVFWFLLAYLIIIFPRYLKYRKSSYKDASGNRFLGTVFNKGNYGEFLTYAKLEKLDEYNKLLVNVYLPKEDGTTTEIDLIMISQTGIYVFESKNYSGWIFGDEKNKYWTQTLENRQKNKFFNPIWQNKGHIKALESILQTGDERIYKSYIIFSERCTLKKISVESDGVEVIKRNNLVRYIKGDLKNKNKLLDKAKIDETYKRLSKYSLVDERVKKKHIEAIKHKRSQ